MNRKQAAFALVTFFAIVSATATLLPRTAAAPAKPKPPFPVATLDDQRAPTPGQQRFVLAGGCFWGIQAVFQHVKGVTKATSGYAGGAAKTASYEQVSNGNTGHAESVEVTYDPAQITYGQLLRVFFSVAHDPTEKNRQGPDEGPQYRSAIFFASERQQEIARAYIAQLNDARIFSKPIATELTALTGFYPAEGYHQNYATKNPFDPYIMVNDRPKVNNLKSQYPDLYTEHLAPAQ
jgi:peptide-methionine (S)-S-oxide reductase